MGSAGAVYAAVPPAACASRSARARTHRTPDTRLDAVPLQWGQAVDPISVASVFSLLLAEVRLASRRDLHFVSTFSDAFSRLIKGPGPDRLVPYPLGGHFDNSVVRENRCR